MNNHITMKRRNTRKHWALYALDAFETEHGREDGATAKDVHEVAEPVFRDWRDVGGPLSQLVKDGLVENRSVESEWGTIIHAYRLTDLGYSLLADFGKPTKLPRRTDTDDRELPAEPSHEITGGRLTEAERDDHWLVTEGPAEWEQTDRERVYFRTSADKRGLNASPNALAREAEQVATSFPDFDVVITCGPYRFHDVMYRVDRESHRINLDYYSIRPGVQFTDSIVHEIRDALRRAAKEEDDG